MSRIVVLSSEGRGLSDLRRKDERLVVLAVALARVEHDLAVELAAVAALCFSQDL